MSEAERRRSPPRADVTAWMREDWDARAREDAQYYINTSAPADFAFALSGARDAVSILFPLQADLRRDMRVLEIGCGIGRLLQHFGLLFAEVHGIDVAPAMVERARAYLARSGNITVHLGNGRNLDGLPDAHFDLAISSHVFQHIPDKSVIAEYVRDTFRVLRPGGLFRFLVKTRPWRGQGEHHDTWCGVELSRDDLDGWVRARRWRLLAAVDTDEDPTLAWVLLQKP